jgi:transposase
LYSVSPYSQGRDNTMERFVGIDVAKETFDLCILPEGTLQHQENNPKGVRLTVEALKALNPTLIVMEATGGYETLLAAELQAANLPVAIVNPRRIRDFARACGRMAKTDRIDARTIAEFAATLRPPVQGLLDRQSRQMKALVARRRQLIEIRVSEANRMEHASEKAISQSLLRILKTLDRETQKIETQLRDQLAQMPELQSKAQLIQSIPGIAETTATMLVTEVPELGRLNRRQIAMLMGVAPINRDSGTLRGKRMTGGGRRQVRTRLFMPTLVAIRHNPVIRSFYERLLKAGKTKMVAVIACMRKLLVILNSLVAKNQSWKPKTA